MEWINQCRRIFFWTDWNSCFNFMEWPVAFWGLRLWMGTALDYYDDRISLKSSPSSHQSANLTSISQPYFTSNSFLFEQSDLREFCDCQIFCLSRAKKNIVYQVHCQRMSRNMHTSSRVLTTVHDPNNWWRAQPTCMISLPMGTGE